MNNLDLNRSRGYESAPSFAVIFSQAIKNGEWIARLTRGECKKGDKQRELNYRPITVYYAWIRYGKHC